MRVMLTFRLLVVLLGSATVVWATDPRKLPRDEEESMPRTLKLEMPDPNTNPVLIAASKTTPVSPERLKQFLPDKLLSYSRKTIEAKLIPLGPAALSDVKATYVALNGKGFELDLIDPAGMPQTGPPFVEIPPIGSRETGAPGEEKLGIDIKGFAARVETSPTSAFLQVALGPRIRLTLSAAGLKGADLVAVVKQIDLPQIAQLASIAPPPLPTVPQPVDPPVTKD